jgi:hypothetical protein
MMRSRGVKIELQKGPPVREPFSMICEHVPFSAAFFQNAPVRVTREFPLGIRCLHHSAHSAHVGHTATGTAAVFRRLVGNHGFGRDQQASD